MRRRIVNHHRLIKTIDRTAQKTGHFFDRLFKPKPAYGTKLKDHTWQGTQYNPYIHKDVSTGKKTLFKLIILFTTVILFVYIIIFSRLFDFTSITITGNSKITKEDILNVVKNTLEYKNWGIIPNSSFFIAHTNDIGEVLKRRFPIDSIQVEKHFPHELSITITEKISTVIYDNGSVYSFVGLDGSVVELIRAVENYEWKDIMDKVVTTTSEGVSTTIEMSIGKEHTPDIEKIRKQIGEYAVVYDKRQHQTDKGLTVMRPEETELIVSWYNEIKNADFSAQLFIIENDTDLSILTNEGWIIKTRFVRTNAPDELREIKLALQKIENRRSLSYIDIRYQNRIYWK